jgi:hypothetical protein
MGIQERLNNTSLRCQLTREWNCGLRLEVPSGLNLERFLVLMASCLKQPCDYPEIPVLKGLPTQSPAILFAGDWPA